MTSWRPCWWVTSQVPTFNRANNECISFVLRYLSSNKGIRENTLLANYLFPFYHIRLGKIKGHCMRDEEEGGGFDRAHNHAIRPCVFNNYT